MADEYETILHRWMEEVWNRGNTETIVELLSNEAVVHGVSAPGQQPVVGPYQFMEFHTTLRQAFEDIHIDLDDVMQTDDRIAGRFTVTGTQTGPLLGMPATGKRVKFTGSGIARVKDGKFTEIWNDIDFLKMQYDLAAPTPAASDYSNFVHRWFDEVWNKGNADVIDEMFAEDGRANGLKDESGNTIVGPKGYKPFHASFRSAFPDLKVEVEDTITEGDKIAVRCRVKATHCGDGIGVTPCNTPVEFTFMSIVRIENGKIAEAWNNVDFMDMYEQLGALKLDVKLPA